MVALKSGKASDAARLISAEMGIRGYAVSAKDLTDALKTAIAAVMVPDGFAVSAAEPDMSLDASPKPAEVADVLELIRQYKRTLEPHLPVPAELPAPFDKLPRTFVESVKGGIYGEMWNPKMAATMVDAINGLMALLHFARRFAFFHETETRT